MNARTVLLMALFVGLAVFALLNWAAFLTPTELSLGLGTVQAPLGLVLLVAIAVITAVFVLYIVMQMAAGLAESRRHSKALQLQQQLADKAEASRFTDLQAILTSALQHAEAERVADSARLNDRLALVEANLVAKLDESTRVLSAYMGEVDDKLDRALPPALS